MRIAKRNTAHIRADVAQCSDCGNEIRRVMHKSPFRTVPEVLSLVCLTLTSSEVGLLSGHVFPL